MDCEAWKRDKAKNPATNRAIKVGGPTYAKIERECASDKADCEAWKKDRSRNPRTGRRIDARSKNGVYAQLAKVCGETPRGRPPTASSSAAAPGASLDRRRAVLASAIRRAIAPVLRRGESTRVRSEYARIVRRYVDKAQPCLSKIGEKLCLADASGEAVVTFDKRIGSDSRYGVAYANAGKGFAKLLKFSCKIMRSGVAAHAREVKLLERMSSIAESGICPNMPIMYRAIECKKPCALHDCPSVAKESKYYVVVSELASYDLHAFFQKKRRQEEYESVVAQIAFAIYCFHEIGYDHDDCHLGNFLVHEIPAGGCWRYRVENRDVYVPNEGYLVVLWDPGLAKKAKDYRTDYARAFGLLANIANYKTYVDRKMIAMPDRFLDEVLVPFSDRMIHAYSDERTAMRGAIDLIASGDYKFRAVRVGGAPPTHLLNVKPFLSGARATRR